MKITLKDETVNRDHATVEIDVGEGHPIVIKAEVAYNKGADGRLYPMVELRRLRRLDDGGEHVFDRT